MGGFMSGMEFTTSIMQVLVITVGGLLIMRGELDYIDLMTFSLYVSTFVTPVAQAVPVFRGPICRARRAFPASLELMRTSHR